MSTKIKFYEGYVKSARFNDFRQKKKKTERRQKHILLNTTEMREKV